MKTTNIKEATLMRCIENTTNLGVLDFFRVPLKSGSEGARFAGAPPWLGNSLCHMDKDAPSKTPISNTFCAAQKDIEKC